MHGPGLSRLVWSAATATLACVGCGAAFPMAGLFFRNSAIAGAVMFVREGANPFPPSVRQKASVVFCPRALAPVKVPCRRG